MVDAEVGEMFGFGFGLGLVLRLSHNANGACGTKYLVFRQLRFAEFF